MIDDVASNLVGRMPLPPETQLGSLFVLDRIALETVVERRPEVACHLARRGDRVMLCLPGGYTLEASERAAPALAGVLAAGGPFRVAEMHESLGGPAKLILAKRLVACGLLRVVGPI